MDNIYEIRMEANASKKIRIKAPTARIAIEMLLNTYFNTDTINFNNHDVDEIDMYAEILNSDEGYECEANCSRCRNVFDVFIDDEYYDEMRSITDTI